MNNMKKTVIIDIGSNSVRKQVFSGGKILLRQTITTQLAKDIENKKLANKSINRTFEGLDELILSETYFSIGGGTIVRQEDFAKKSSQIVYNVPHQFNSCKELQEI
jgi:hypothetical protein